MKGRFTQFEESITKELGEETLNGWKAREAAWKEKAVKLEEKRDLPNEYEPPFEFGTSKALISRCTDESNRQTALNAHQMADKLIKEAVLKNDTEGARNVKVMHEALELRAERFVA